MRVRTSILLLALALGWASEAGAQEGGEVIGGMLVGAFISLPVALGYSALRAQAGDYIWNPSESVDRVLVVSGVVIGVSAGVAIGASDRYRVGDALGGAIVGGAAGALLGRGISQFTSSGSEGRWAGTLMGLGAGTLIGSIWATVARAEQREEEPVPMVSARIPLAIPGLSR